MTLCNINGQMAACSAMRRLSAETAGAVALPRGASPNASTSRAIVLAVPITPHVPTVGTSASLASDISSSVSLPALKSPQRRRQSVQAPTRSPRKLPVLMARLPAGQRVYWRSARPSPGQAQFYHTPDQDHRIHRQRF